MRLATVIGRVTLSVRHPKYRGERLLLVLPWKTETLTQPDPDKRFDFSIVVYDELGAHPGQTIAVSEGREAASPFPDLRPVDAYCAALIDAVVVPTPTPAP